MDFQGYQSGITITLNNPFLYQMPKFILTNVNNFAICNAADKQYIKPEDSFIPFPDYCFIDCAICNLKKQKTIISERKTNNRRYDKTSLLIIIIKTLPFEWGQLLSMFLKLRKLRKRITISQNWLST